MDELIDEEFIPKKEVEPEGEPPPRALTTAIRLIDTYVGELSGKIFMLMIFPLIGGLTYEVIARYVFDAPTKWAYDTSYMLYGSHFMLGAAYCLYKGTSAPTFSMKNSLSAGREGLTLSSTFSFSSRG